MIAIVKLTATGVFPNDVVYGHLDPLTDMVLNRIAAHVPKANIIQPFTILGSLTALVPMIMVEINFVIQDEMSDEIVHPIQESQLAEGIMNLFPQTPVGNIKTLLVVVTTTPGQYKWLSFSEGGK